MSVTIKYKGAEIASASTDTTKTIKTSGKYCEADIEVINTPDGGDAPVINPLSVTANGTYTAPSGVDGYSPVTVNVSGGGLPKIGTVATDPTDGSYGSITFPVSASGMYLLCNVSVAPSTTNRLPYSTLVIVDTSAATGAGAAIGYNSLGASIGNAQVAVTSTNAKITATSAVRFGVSATYDLYKID